MRCHVMETSLKERKSSFTRERTPCCCGHCRVQSRDSLSILVSSWNLRVIRLLEILSKAGCSSNKMRKSPFPEPLISWGHPDEGIQTDWRVSELKQAQFGTELQSTEYRDGGNTDSSFKNTRTSLDRRGIDWLNSTPSTVAFREILLEEHLSCNGGERQRATFPQMPSCSDAQTDARGRHRSWNVHCWFRDNQRTHFALRSSPGH